MNLATGTVGGKLSVSAAIALSRPVRARKQRSSEHARAGDVTYNSNRAPQQSAQQYGLVDAWSRENNRKLVCASQDRVYTKGLWRFGNDLGSETTMPLALLFLLVQAYWQGRISIGLKLPMMCTHCIYTMENSDLCDICQKSM